MSAETAVDAAAMRVARRIAHERIEQGALAVVLTGSHVRGEAHHESDIDLVVVLARSPAGKRWTRPYDRRGQFLIAAAWETASTVRAGFREPRLMCTFVPGWREARILADPTGIAARLQREARRWTWGRMNAVCDAWVATQITGYAEEVHKLVIALERGSAHAAAAQRAAIALRMAQVVAVRHRILYGTENVLWDLAAGQMGPAWADAQAAALGLRRVTHEEGCHGALDLYALTVAEVASLLDRQQRAVVMHALTLARSASR